MARRYWLLKSEPDVFSFDDLMASPDRTTCWDGVRNYQARNFMRDDMKPGDGVLFYHSRVKPMAIVGLARVAKRAYPDHTAFDEADKHYDPKSDPANPTWMMVDIQGVKPLPEPLTLEDLKATRGLEEMLLLRKGQRLSEQPVTAAEWSAVLKRAGIKEG